MNKENLIPVFAEFENNTNWCSGEVGNYTFSAKLFDTGSIHGINEGRVSKLDMWNEEGSAVSYCRGWDKKPNKEVKPAYDALMTFLESAPKRFS